MWFVLRVILRLIRLASRSPQDLVLENLLLRHQIAVLERTRRRPALEPQDRRFWSVATREWSGWRAHVHIVQSATVVRWQRTARRRYWRWRSRGGHPGCPRIDAETHALIARISGKNRRWGHQRTVGELQALGLSVSTSTVRRYRRASGYSPSPAWRTLLRLHARGIWAADFCSVQTLTFRTLFVFFLITHDRPAGSSIGT